ncbi:MAG: hypothetical protein ACUVTM_04670 [Candidatus Bathyarchaeia archaeon]
MSERMVERCVDCGRRASRGLKYCDICRKIHFVNALNAIRHFRSGKEHYGRPISNNRREMRIYFESDGQVEEGVGLEGPGQSMLRKDHMFRRMLKSPAHK